MAGQVDFLKALAKDPGLIDKLGKQENLRGFKDKYDVEKTSGLKCPSCAAYLQSPGSLYYNPSNPIHFVCRKCKLEFRIFCLTIENIVLIEELKRVAKGEGGLPSWIKQEGQPEEENGHTE